MHATRLSRVRALILSVSVSLGVLSAGCVSAPEPAVPSSFAEAGTPTPSASATQTPSPSPTSTPDDPSDPSSWVIGEDRVGPLRIGQSFAATLRELPGAWATSSACSWLANWVSPDGAYAISFKRADGSMIGDIVAISVSRMSGQGAAGPATTDGVQVGTKLESLGEYTEVDPRGDVEDESWFTLAGATPDDADATLFFRGVEDRVHTLTLTVNAAPGGTSCT